MENLTVRKLTDKDADIFEEYICSFVAEEKTYLTDNFLKNQKKYIEFHDFNEWYNTNKDNNLNIYLVFSSKKQLIGSFQIYRDSECATIDVRPSKQDKNYEREIINFIHNICYITDTDVDFLLSTKSNLELEKLEQSQDIYTYKYDKNKVLIKKN